MHTREVHGKQDNFSDLVQGLFPTHELPDSGGSLALRALAWGTFYAVAGVGSLCFGVWKLLGVHDVSVVVSPPVFDSGVSFVLCRHKQM